MTELAAWVAFPLIALVLLTGVGLLVERVARLELEPALLAPLGFCAAIALVGPGYALEQGAELALGLVAAAAIAGLVLARRELWPRLRPGPGALAALVVYALYIAPVALHGVATFLGYNFLNDTAIHLALVDYLDDWGRRHPGFLPEGTFRSAMFGYVGVDYPLGSHELMAALREALPLDAARLYQPFIALCAALAGSALYAVVRGVGAPRAAAAGAAALALSSQLLYSFNLQGGIKEVSFVTALAAIAGTGAAVVRGGPALGGGLAVGLCALGAYAIYGLAALAWLAPAALLIGLGLLLRARERRVRRVVLAAAAVLAVFAVLGVPTIAGSIDYYRHGQVVLESEGELGPLGGPIRRTQASGVWLNGDYRYAPENKTPNDLLVIAVFALAALGTGFAVWRRMLGPLLFLAPAGLAWIVVSGRSSPYIDAKLLCVLSPAVLLFAALGVAAVRRLAPGPLRHLALPAALLLLGGAAVGNALAYRIALHAPMDRLDELTELGERYEGQGQLMLNEFEEYAKHFARRTEVVPPYEAWTTATPQLREPGGIFGQAYTLDELEQSYILFWNLIAVRRSPAEARPPAGFELDWRGRFYEVWRRRERPNVAEHVPLGERATRYWGAAAEPDCDRVRALSRRGDLVAVERPAAVLFDISQGGQLPPGWNYDGADAYGIVARGAGTVRGRGTTGAGAHTVWIRGRSFRDDEVLIDGRRVGIARHLNGPNQWIEVGKVTLEAGAHTAELRRPDGSLAPGDRQPDSLGPIVLVPDGEPRELRVPRGQGERLCGRTLDWLELIPRES
jgi:hypothetical protein